MTKKHPKLDPHVISLKQKYEVDYIVAKFKKEGIAITKDNITAMVKLYGRSRRVIYKAIRGNYPKNKK
jgi:DNA polymerase III delta subunit